MKEESKRTYDLAQKFIKWRGLKRTRSQKKYYLRRYQITPEEFKFLLDTQKHMCAICGKTFENSKKTHIDHDHYTLRIRGILCSNCNLGLGNFKDNTDYLASAIRYLLGSPTEVTDAFK